MQILSWEKKRGCYGWVCLPEATVELIQTQQNQVQKLMPLKLGNVQGLVLLFKFNATSERTYKKKIFLRIQNLHAHKQDPSTVFHQLPESSMFESRSPETYIHIHSSAAC